MRSPSPPPPQWCDELPRDSIKDRYFEHLRNGNITLISSFIRIHEHTHPDLINCCDENDNFNNFTKTAAENRSDNGINFAFHRGGSFPPYYDIDSLINTIRHEIYEIYIYEQARKSGGILGDCPSCYPQNNTSAEFHISKLAYICEKSREIWERDNCVNVKPAKR